MAGSSHYDRVAELGSRHLQILELILEGCSNQEIAKATELTLGTVKNYVSAILLALDVQSRSHLISLFFGPNPNILFKDSVIRVN